MRKVTNSGPCSNCGRTSGMFWLSVPKTLDFGVGVPMETAARGRLLCDDCEHWRRHREERGYDNLCPCPYARRA